MFVILTYDIGVKRISKVSKICRMYLFHVQNSVFEGHITEARLKQLKSELKKTIIADADGICIYEFDSIKYARKEQLGMVLVYSNIIE